MATLSVLSPKPPSPVSPQVSLVHSAFPLPGIYFLWLTPSIVNLVSLHSAFRLKKPHSQSRVPSRAGAIVSPQAACACRVVVYLSRKAGAIWGITQHQSTGVYSPCSLPKVSIPSVSSGVSSPFCPHLCWSPG